MTPSVPPATGRLLASHAGTSVRSLPQTQQTVISLQRSGFDPIPLCTGQNDNDRKAPACRNWQRRSFQPSDWKPGQGIGLRTGRQRDGGWLYVVDLDHKPECGIDAGQNFEATLDRLPEVLCARLFLARSTRGHGRYMLFKTRHELRSGYLYNERGQKIGDFLGPGRQVVLPTPDRWLQRTLDDVPVFDDNELASLLTAIRYTRAVDADIPPPEIDLDWGEVELYLGNMQGVLKRIKERTVTYKQLHGDGGPDRSKARWGLACELRRRYGYPNVEIAAILLHFDFGHLTEKGLKWLKGDIERCIAGANEKYPEATVNRSRCLTNTSRPIPDVKRPRRGRPPCLTPEKLYANLQRMADGYTVMQTEAQLAQRYKVSVPTIRRRIAALKQQGLITVEVVRKGRHTYSYVVLSAIKNATAAAALVQSTADEASHSNAQNGAPSALKEVHTCERGSLEDDVCAPEPVARPSLAAAVHAMRAAGAKTRKQVRRMLDAYFPNHPWSVAVIDRHFDAERAHDRRQRAIERDQHKVRAAMPSELRRMARSYAWKHTDARNHGHAKQAYLWGCKAQLVEEEIARRQQAGEWPSERKHRRELLHGAVVAPTSLLAWCEPAPTPPTDAGAPAGACVPPRPPARVGQPSRARLAVNWEYVERMYRLGEMKAIENHCYGRGDVHAVLAHLRAQPD